MDFLKTTTALAAALLSCASAYAQNVDRVHVTGVSIERSDADVAVSFTVHPRQWRLGLERQTTVMPQLVSADGKDTVSMRPFTVAGKNAWYQVIRDGRDADEVMLLRAGRDDALVYTGSVPRQEWMEHARLDFVAVASCYCEGDVPEAPAVIPVAEMDWRKPAFRPDFRYVIPPIDTVKMYSLAGRAYVNFRVNRTDIDPNYMQNREELDKILRTLEDVRNDPAVAVRDITITGYASPEGPYANNERLADGRTAAVKEYVLARSPIDTQTIHTSSVAEDWAGLRHWVTNSRMSGRDAILAIIDSDREPDNREWVLKSTYPEQYRHLLGNVYPSLRHTDYVITYVVRKYTDTEEIRRVMKERPGNLSLDELFLGANSYPEGSAEYRAAFELAATVYPASPLANLNAATAAMSDSDFAKAGAYLDRAGSSPEAEYARGILLALQGDCSGAREPLRRALAEGYAPAGEAIERIDAVENHKGTVTFVGNTPRE